MVESGTKDALLGVRDAVNRYTIEDTRSPARSIVCAGEALVDSIDGATYAGGAPMNVACALARLGTPSRFIGCIGEDARGQLLVDTLRARGVDARFVQRSRAYPTRGVVVRHDAHAERAFAGFDPPGCDAFADMQLDAREISADAFDRAAALAIGTLALAAPASRAAIERCIGLARAAGVPVVLDANRRDIFWPDPAQASAIVRAMVLPHASILKLAADEAVWLFDTEDAARIAGMCGAALVLITHGAQGCAYATKTARGHSAALPVQAVDTTGAGDAFLAGVLHRLVLAGMRFDAGVVADAVHYGTVAGALTTRSPGALDAQPTDEEVAAQRT